MHPLFSPLNDREAMLLLTTLMVAGKEHTHIFEHLPAEERGRLDEKVEALLAIPSQKRVPFMAKQMRQAVAFKGLRGVERVDPSWLVQGMRGESARICAAILVSLPPATVRSVVRRMPPAVKQKLPSKEQFNNVPVELIRAVRQMFESGFHAMPTGGGRTFAFSDVIHLERAELYQLMRTVGLVELGQAFVAVGRLALAEFCRRLPRSRAQELIKSVRRAGKAAPPDMKTAQRFLSRVVVNFSDAEDFFHKAGLWRFAKASLPESEAWRQAFQQRIPRDSGRLYGSFLEKAAELEDLEESSLRRIQDTILVKVSELSEAEVISIRWSQLDQVYNDAEFAQIFREADLEEEVAENENDKPDNALLQEEKEDEIEDNSDAVAE